MNNTYNETERTWQGPSIEHNYPNIGLGHSILLKLKETDPKRILELEHDSKATLTAGEILSQTVTVTQNLMRLGVQKGDIVIVYANSNIKITPIAFALYTIGAPINFFYLDLKGDDRKYYFQLLNPKVILYEEEYKDDVFEALENISLSNLKHTISLDSKTKSVDEVLFKPTARDIHSFQPPDVGDTNVLPALLAFTSGSTGRPKIALHTHAMVLLGVYNKWWHMAPKSVVCVLSDIRWICQIEMMLQPVFFEVTRIYTSRRNKNFDYTYVYELLLKNKVTHFCIVPTYLLETLQNVENANEQSKLSNLRTLMLVGEVITESMIKYLSQIIPKCKINCCYAMTELYANIASDEELHGTGGIVNGGILGNGYTLRVLDESGNNLGPNEKGRLCLKSTVPLLGYFKNDVANEEHFKGDGWCTTEDYGYMDSNHLLNVIIRYKYLLRYNGQFVVPTDVESIVNDHPNVSISALVGYPDPERGDSDIGTFFVALKDSSQRDSMTKELLSLLRRRLTEEQTKYVRFFKIIENVPIINAKLNRSALKEMAAIESANYLRI